MQKLAEICINRPIFAAMLVLALVVVGAASYFKLGQDRFPAVDLPTVSVRTTLPGASPEEVEAEVTQKIEEVVNTVEGITELRSVSGSGVSNVTATFNLDRDIDVAAQDVRDRVQSALRNLPDGVDPPIVRKANNDSSPVMTVAVTANRSVRELTEIADKIVRIQLERSTGVGEVAIVGGLERSIRIWVDADRLTAYQLPITSVRDAIAQQNADAPGGNVTNDQQEQTLRTIGRFRDPKQFNDLVVSTINGAPIRVSDIGYAEDGTYEQRSLARLNGVPTVILELRRQSGANTVALIESAKQNMKKIAAQLPADVKLEVIRDQSRYIKEALHEINVHLILGSILACIVVLFFMRSWRSTIIAGVAIPTSVISTFGMMWALNFTLNSVTMLALVLMVGIVIDDAIVVLENIFRFIEEKRMSAKEAARAATAEIGLAVLATTLSLVVIFLPVSFMSSISGRFLYQFGLTAAVAILVSLLVSFTLTPMMSARLLKKEAHAGKEDNHGVAKSRKGFYALLDKGYIGTLRLAMRYRFVVVVIALAVMASSVFFYSRVKQEYIPTDVDEAEFEISVTAPQQASLAAMDEVMRTVEGELKKVRGVRTMLTSAGGGFLARVNTGSVYVRIAPHEERVLSFTHVWNELRKGNILGGFRDNYTQRDVMNEVRKRLRKYRDLRIGVRNLPSFSIGAGGNFDIDFSIRGPELQELAKYVDTLRDNAGKLGIIDADTTLKLDDPELQVRIDHERAADLGVKTSDITTALRLMVGGEEQVSRFRDESLNEDYDVQLRLIAQDRSTPGEISHLYVPRTNIRNSSGSSQSSGGSQTSNSSQLSPLVPLDNLVTIEPAKNASRIDRLDRQRQSSLRGSVAPGFALADRIEALRDEVKRMNLPPAYTTAISGRGRELERTFTEFLYAFLLSIIFMYMILASQFESLTHPFTILLSLPLSVPFALLSLWATGNTLNLYSALGILVLFGVVKKNSILQVDHMNHLRAQGMSRYDAIIQGNSDRLRPILMTTLALVAGMLPLWLGSGPGSEERRAIAVVVIGGQSLSLLLTLIVTPVAYSYLDDLSQSEKWIMVRDRIRQNLRFIVPKFRSASEPPDNDARERG